MVPVWAQGQIALLAAALRALPVAPQLMPGVQGWGLEYHALAVWHLQVEGLPAQA